MCGIAGLLKTNPLQQEDSRILERMRKLLYHRGPDGSGIYQDLNCGLVQTRLALVDQSIMNLPWCDSSGRFQIVFNGEIYNYQELKDKLRFQYDFQTDTDTEVLLAAWLQWGPQVLQRLEGMFAFVIWDSVEKTGWAARDVMGVKPFFYAMTQDDFYFSSEPGALVKSGAWSFSIDEESLAETLTAPYFSGAVRTPFHGIRPLEPGTWIEWKDGKIRQNEFFNFIFQPVSFDSPDLYMEKLEDALKESVQASMLADAEVGLFLSGGLDSSLIAAMMTGTRKSKIKSWSIHYPENEIVGYKNSLIVKSSDLPYAKQVAEAFNLDLQAVSVGQDLYEAPLLRTLQSNDMICAWEQEVSQNILAEAAVQSAKAVLVGDAADETHFGYSFLMNDQMIDSPKNILEFFGTLNLKKSFMKNPLLEFDHMYRARAEKQGYNWSTLEDKRLATAGLVTELWLRRLLYNGDVHTMAHSLEARVPFANLKVLKLAQNLSSQFAMNQKIEKWHLRKISEKYLSPALAWRPKSALTKSFAGKAQIHFHLNHLWKESSELLSPYLEMDKFKKQLQRSSDEWSDRDVSVAFRVLSVLTWMRNYL